MAWIEAGNPISIPYRRNGHVDHAPEVPIPGEEIGLHLTTPHPSDPELLRVELASGRLGEGIDLDPQVPTEDDRQDMTLHRQLGMHTGREGRDEDLALRGRIIAAQHMC